ncbi:unnamed protein product [Closterium sp. Naga37s-1]|nr:unnamed protein product [Closterium sp. Naga37s-1]
MKESKLTACKDKERATDVALTAVRGKGGAGPKANAGGWRTATLDATTSPGLLECKQRIEKGLEPVTNTWKETGVSIASDMMTDKCGRALMNIICINDSGAVFTEAIDCKADTKCGAFIAGILRPVIEKVGPEHVGALCTDGGSNYVAACKLLHKKYPHIEIVPCATHVLDLPMEDIGGMDWAQEVLHGEKVMKPLRPAGTRFGTQYIAVPRLCQIRSQLTQMVLHKDWAEKGKNQTGKVFEAMVMDAAWWKKAETFVKVMELPYRVMRRTDGAAKGKMGAMTDIMLLLTEELSGCWRAMIVGSSRRIREGVQEHLRRRWDESLAWPLHVVGRILNPANQEGIFLKDVECTRVMKAWLARSMTFVDKYWKKSSTQGTSKALQEAMLTFVEGKGCFGTEEAIEGRAELQAGKGDMLTWWKLNGWEYADLAGLACRALSQPVLAGTVVHNYHKGAAGAGQSGEVRKAGVVGGNIPTPPLPEGCKLEEDGDVEVDEDDMCVDEYEHQEDEEEEEKESEEEDEDE